MVMDYNKWGVVTGMVGLVWIPISYIFDIIIDQIFRKSLDLILFVISPSLIFGIVALALGILSIKKRENKKAALVLGAICTILSMYLMFKLLTTPIIKAL